MLRILAEMTIRDIMQDRFPSLKIVKLIKKDSSGFIFQAEFSKKASIEKMYPAEKDLYTLSDNGKLPLSIKLFSHSYKPDEPVHQTAVSVYNSVSGCKSIAPVYRCGEYFIDEDDNGQCFRYIITPYYPLTLNDVELTGQECIQLTLDICNALIAMHNRAEYTHGNISFENILFNSDSSQGFLGGYEDARPVEDILYGAQLDLPVTDIQRDIRALGECIQEFIGADNLRNDLPDFKNIIDKSLGLNGGYAIAEEMAADLTALQSKYWIEMKLEQSSSNLFFHREDKGMAVFVLQEILRNNILGNPVIISGTDDFDRTNIIHNFFKEYEYIYPSNKSIRISANDVSDTLLNENSNLFLLHQIP